MPAWTGDQSAGAEGTLRQRPFARRTLPGGARAGSIRARLFLGRRAHLLAGAGCLDDRGGLFRRAYAEPDLRRGVQRANRPYRGRPRGLRPESDELRGAPQAVLGEPRPEPGHAPGQRCRHAIPLGNLHLYAGAAPRRRSLARSLSEGAECRRLRRDHDRDQGCPALLLRRGLPPAISGEEPVRLLRAWRYRRLLPDWHLGGRISYPVASPVDVLRHAASLS